MCVCVCVCVCVVGEVRGGGRVQKKYTVSWVCLHWAEFQCGPPSVITPHSSSWSQGQRELRSSSSLSFRVSVNLDPLVLCLSRTPSIRCLGINCSMVFF